MVQFFVHGVPAPKGSAIAIQGKRLGPPCAKCGVTKRGRPIVIPASGKTKPWEKVIRGACLAALERQEKICGPVKVTLVFYMPRPKKHYLKHGLRDNAPHWHESRADIDKLCRSTNDALTDLVFEDDCKIVRLISEKVYANGGTQHSPAGRCGVQITVESAAQCDSQMELLR